MNFATWSIRNPIPSILFFIMITVAGIYGFKHLPVENFPDITLPNINATLALPGAVPAQLEAEVARKVENSIATLSGVKHIRTSITDGAVSVNVIFELEKPLSDALIETKDAIDSVRSDLPPELYSPVVSAVRIGGNPLVIYAIQSTKMDEGALTWFVDDTLSKTLLGVKGVGRFERLGGIDREVQINVDPTKLASLGVTASSISRALKQIQMEYSGGRAQIGGMEQSIRTIGTVKQASDLNAMPIALPDGRMVRLDQVATVSDTYAERTQADLLDGNATVGFSIYRAKGFDETKVEKAAEAAITQLITEHPDLKITPILNTVKYTREQYNGSMDMLYEGAFLAVLVVWFFLRDWRATLISAAALPLSIIPAFGVMQWLGYSLNTLTLLALAVIVGILVDDAIVEVENIVRHKNMGKPVRQAAEEAVNEIALAVIATTFTLVVVFVPTSMMSDVSGLIFRQFGWTVVIAVLVSLLVARLITPIMAATFLKSTSHHQQHDSRMMQAYLRVVRYCLVNRGKTALFAILFFIASISLAPLLPAGFIPPSDIGFTMANFELPPGNTLTNTLATAEDARKALADVKGIEHIFTMIGNARDAGMGQKQAGEVRRGSLFITLTPHNTRPGQTEIENTIRTKLLQVPGARFNISTGGPGEKLTIILSGDNDAALTQTAKNVEQELRGIGSLNNISSSASLDRPEIIIRPNAIRAAELGINTQAIGDTVRIATAGDFDTQLSRLNLDNRQVYIRVRLTDAVRQDINSIASLRIPTKYGQTSLGSIAEISNSTGPSQIDRYDRNRYVTVSADLGGAALGEAMANAKQLPSIKNMPSSVHLINAGDAEFMNELFTGFGIAIITGILCVFCVLVLLFKDFFQPITILSALPLSVGGVIVSLLLAREQMSLPALIGIVMLMGIVTKNSILLVEYAIVSMRERGLNLIDALIDACHKRARPIVMTTTAMIAGMMPIALGFGGDASFRQPMAIAVIGGLITSTALCLIVVPVVFTYVHAFKHGVYRFFDSKNIHALSEADLEEEKAECAS